MTIKCTAPIRICDLGGWTDTWFAGSGKILNIAVFPSVEVTIVTSKKEKHQRQITIFAENYGDIYSISPYSHKWTKHPLIEAAFKLFKLPNDMHIDVTIFSEAPSGASTGTSAAVSVAILGALDLIGQPTLTTYEIAVKSHYIESCLLKLQTGIQDQLSAAYGGINFIEMSKYPEASVSQIALKDELLWELESRLLLVYLGKPHSSSEIHNAVIKRLEESHKYRKHLTSLREAAVTGKEALLRGDLSAFGSAMIENTRSQTLLHPNLVGERAQLAIDIALKRGVCGYKVNGAGGAGGSVTLLMTHDCKEKHDLIQLLQKAHPEFKNIPIRIAPYGLRRWKSEQRSDPIQS